MTTRTRATLDDLMRVSGKAELVNGEIVHMPPTGDERGTAEDEIYFSLRMHVQKTGAGHAVSDNKAFRVDLPHRGSFSPDAAYYTGPRGGMKFFPQPPVFAAEVRSEGDYGPRAEQAMANKRADYFAGGTLVVWDVDLLSEKVVRKYTTSDPDHPTVFRRGQIADAEPAVPGWRMAVEDMFRRSSNGTGLRRCLFLEVARDASWWTESRIAGAFGRGRPSCNAISEAG